MSKIGLPSTRLNDQAKIFSWDYRLKLNQYLKTANNEVGIDWQIVIKESLEGKDIENVVEALMTDGSNNGALFLLSLSDRKFKISFAPQIIELMGENKVDELVSLVIPSLAKSEHQQAIYLLLEASSFALEPSFKVSPPRPSLRKHRSLKGFTYFLAAFFFVFLLGHKVFSGSKTKAAFSTTNPDSSGPTEKLFHHSFFFKNNINLPKNSLEDFKERIGTLSSQKDLLIYQFHAQSSDLYPAAHFRSALALSIVALTFLYFFPLEWRDPIYILAVFAQVLIIGYLLAFFSRIKRFYTSKREMKEETFQLLIETVAKDYDLLLRPSLTIGYSRLENKIDFIFSAPLIYLLQKQGADLKEISQLIKNKTIHLRKGEFKEFFDALISFLEIKLNSLPKIKPTEEKPLLNEATQSTTNIETTLLPPQEAQSSKSSEEHSQDSDIE
jgi:hypothetical protein